MSGPATTPGSGRRTARFFAGFLLVALLAAGLLSYLASPEPDGLDTVAQRGCEVTEVDGVERLTGECIAQHGTEHPFAAGPLAGYSVGGDERLTGAAGVLGVLVTLAGAGALFWLLGRRPAGRPRD